MLKRKRKIIIFFAIIFIAILLYRKLDIPEKVRKDNLSNKIRKLCRGIFKRI